MRRSIKATFLVAGIIISAQAAADTGTLTAEQRAQYQANWAMQVAISFRAHHVPRGAPKQAAWVSMVLLPTGEVQTASIARSSGDPAYDESVVRAAYQSSPLPLPSNPEAFDSRIRLCVPAELCPH